MFEATSRSDASRHTELELGVYSGNKGGQFSEALHVPLRYRCTSETRAPSNNTNGANMQHQGTKRVLRLESRYRIWGCDTCRTSLALHLIPVEAAARDRLLIDSKYSMPC